MKIEVNSQVGEKADAKISKASFSGVNAPRPLMIPHLGLSGGTRPGVCVGLYVTGAIQPGRPLYTLQLSSSTYE